MCRNMRYLKANKQSNLVNDYKSKDRYKTYSSDHIQQDYAIELKTTSAKKLVSLNNNWLRTNPIN